MSLSKEKQLKFEPGSTTDPLIIKKACMEELNFGSKYVVYIEKTIEGFDHFLPSDGLIKKIKEENVDIDDTIKIIKVEPSDKWPHGYFNVEMVKKSTLKSDNNADKIEMDKYATGETKPVKPIDKGVANFEKQFEESDTKLENHELSARLDELFTKVERLQKTTAILWTDYGTRTSDAGHKPGDDDIPF